MDSIPVLDLWNVVIEVLHSSNNVPPTQNISTPKNNRDHNSTRRPQRKQQRVKLGAGGGKSAKFWAPSPSSHPPLPHPHTFKPQQQIPPKNKSKGASGNCRRNTQDTWLEKEGDRNVDQLSNLNHLTIHAHSSQGKLHLYIFEDNEAVIKMIIKGRSPMMRHVSRTHRVALSWLFDRINLETRIQIKYVDTKNPLADLLTKGSFTRDEWCNLLRLFNIMTFSIFSRSHFRSVE